MTFKQREDQVKTSRYHGTVVDLCTPTHTCPALDYALTLFIFVSQEQSFLLTFTYVSVFEIRRCSILPRAALVTSPHLLCFENMSRLSTKERSIAEDLQIL